MQFPYKVINQNYLGATKPKSALIKYIKDRLHKRDGHIILIISGSTGSGKSYAGLRICEQVDPYFNADRISFDVKNYADQMGDFYPRGSAFMLEEGQHMAHNLNFYSSTNKGLFYLLSTLRHRNYLTVITLPNLPTFDKQSKRLMHIDIRMTGNINERAGKAKGNLFFPKQSEFKDKLYLNKMRVSGKDGRREIADAWFKKPSTGLLKLYHVKKTMFTSNLSKKVSLTLEETQAKKIKKMEEGK